MSNFFGNVIGVTAGAVMHAVEEGIAFRCYDRIQIPGNGSVYWSAITSPGKAIILYSRRLSSTQPMLTYEVIAGASNIDYGTALPTYNLNDESDNTSSVVIRRLTAAPTGGSIFDFDEVIGEGGSGANSVGGFTSVEDIRIVKSNSELILKITNGSNSQANASLYLRWFEVQTKYLHGFPE